LLHLNFCYMQHNVQWDDVRTYRQGKQLGWQIPVQEILHHVMTGEKECPLLGVMVGTRFTIIPEYQQRAA
jgi:hypothetical protein